MSSLRCTHRFNKRHKIVIAVCTIAVLLLNIGPYTVFTAPEVEVEHSQCIELRKDPLSRHIFRKIVISALVGALAVFGASKIISNR